jgi:hypothetical protein
MTISKNYIQAKNRHTPRPSYLSATEARRRMKTCAVALAIAILFCGVCIGVVYQSKQQLEDCKNAQIQH